MGYPHKPHPNETVVLSEHFGNVKARTLDGWKAVGGYQALEKARAMQPAELIELIKASGLRGRDTSRISG